MRRSSGIIDFESGESDAPLQACAAAGQFVTFNCDLFVRNSREWVRDVGDVKNLIPERGKMLITRREMGIELCESIRASGSALRWVRNSGECTRYVDMRYIR